MKKECNLKGFQQVLVRNENGECWNRHIFDFYDESSEFPYYCIGFDNYKYCIAYESNEHLAGTDKPYVEPYEPQDGDFVYVENSIFKYIFIKKEGAALTEKYISLNIEYGNLSDECHKCCDDEYIISIRPATEEERNQLLSKLHEFGKDWDAEKKKIVDWKWSPNEDEFYYIPFCSQTDFTPLQEVWVGGDNDKCFHKRGWVFRTEEECQAMCDKLNAAIKNVK